MISFGVGIFTQNDVDQGLVPLEIVTPVDGINILSLVPSKNIEPPFEPLKEGPFVKVPL